MRPAALNADWNRSGRNALKVMEARCRRTTDHRSVQVQEPGSPGRDAGSPVHLTTIWAAVEDGAVWVRSYRGTTAGWYGEALADPQIALHVAGRRLAVRSVPATDADSIRACSAALARVYDGSPDLPSMLVPEILDTTLRLDPA